MFRSRRSLLLSLAIHGVAVIALFAIHFTVPPGTIPTRATRVRLIAPVPARRVKRIVVRMTSMRLPAHVTLKLPAPALPSLAPPVVPIRAAAIKAPPVVMETAAKVQPVSERPVVIQTDVFASAATARQANPTLPMPARTVAVVSAGFGDAGVAPTA